MNTISLHPVYQTKDNFRRYVGITIVVAFHALILYGIVSGTAKNALRTATKSLEAVVIQEVIVPPPPPPPPPAPKPAKEIRPPEVPKLVAPPPPFIPPPEVVPPSTAGPAVVSTTVAPTAPAPIAPPPPPAPPVATGPARSDIHVACPTQVSPEMPRRAMLDGTEGVVKAQVLIKDGVVQNVTILSGPRVFHAPVRAAMMQYKCNAGSGEVLATQEFAFKIE